MVDYYVFRLNGNVKRIAKIEDNSIAYGWERGEWVEMPGLLKIQNEDTDYIEITKKECDYLIDKLKGV